MESVKKDIKAVEAVQHRATIMVNEVRHLNYRASRRTRGDLIQLTTS